MSRDRTYPLWRRRKIRLLQERLLRWYGHHKRTLPWRSNPTPYRVWVAEIMLQQTRVQTVLAYYDRFLERFPDIETLATASEQEVIELWAGLGYYRRARHLHEAARLIVAESTAPFPQTLEDIKRLPGVGRYTAGAIYSIAFHQPEPVVDGNVKRVISRLQGIRDAPAGYFWRAAETWLAQDEPADFNQAVMELGALVCTPRDPLCAECPLRSLCKSGRAHRVPRARKRFARARETVKLVLLVLECEGQVLLTRQAAGGFIPGEWGLPMRILPKNGLPLTGAGILARRILGSVPDFRAFPPVHHGITYRTIKTHIFRATLAPPPPRLAPANQFLWQPRAGIERLLTSSLFVKCLAASMPTEGS